MTTKSSKGSPRELDDIDRTRIGAARDVLKEYGQYVDVAEMSDVAFERRVCRMKAMDLSVEATKDVTSLTSDYLIDLAGDFFDFIWNGKEPDGSVRD